MRHSGLKRSRNKKKEFEKAFFNQTKSIEILQSCFPYENNLHFVKFFHNMGDIYFEINESQKAFDYFMKSKSILEKLFPNNKDHPLLIKVYKSMSKTIITSLL